MDFSIWKYWQESFEHANKLEDKRELVNTICLDLECIFKKNPSQGDFEEAK